MLTLNNKNGIQHSNKNELHFLRGLTFGFVLQAKLCKRCNCSPSVIIFPNFHLNKDFFHLSLSSSRLVKLNERNFLSNLLENIASISKGKKFQYKGILIEKYKNQFYIFELADNLNKL